MICATGLDKNNASEFAHMLLDWDAVYAEALANADSNQPPKESLERVLAGMFALRGWVPYV